MGPRVLTSSRTIPVEVEDAYDRMLAMPLPQLFSRRYAVFPPITEVRDSPAPWGTEGQSRRIVLADGGSVVETITEADPPRTWAYELTEVTGAMKPLVRTVDGRWSFAPAGTGTRVGFSWIVHPAGRLGRAAMPVLAWAWAGYARQALEELERHLVP
jgi:hypothetical protein